MRDIVSFCEQYNIVLMADEVYQTNIYGNVPFISFKKVVMEMKSKIQLVSFHSVSKGFLGEYGKTIYNISIYNVQNKYIYFLDYLIAFFLSCCF
jgi:hypothetical protein